MADPFPGLSSGPSPGSSSGRIPLAGPPPESLVTVLDRLLDTGVVADGQLVLSVAGVDLIFVGVRALLASMDTATRMALTPCPVPSATFSAATLSAAPLSAAPWAPLEQRP